MKKGFTLVELLVVIAIIGLLIAIAVPSGLAISKKIKEKMLDTKIELIESSAIVWGQGNKSKIPTGVESCSIEDIVGDSKVSHCLSMSISELLNENALEEDEIIDNKKVLINPVTNKPLNECNVEIYIKNKRVYAKYDINGTNCGYEKSDDSDESEIENVFMTVPLPSSLEVFDYFETNGMTKDNYAQLIRNKLIDYLKDEDYKILIEHKEDSSKNITYSINDDVVKISEEVNKDLYIDCEDTTFKNTLTEEELEMCLNGKPLENIYSIWIDIEELFFTMIINLNSSNRVVATIYLRNYYDDEYEEYNLSSWLDGKSIIMEDTDAPILLIDGVKASESRLFYTCLNGSTCAGKLYEESEIDFRRPIESFTQFDNYDSIFLSELLELDYSNTFDLKDSSNNFTNYTYSLYEKDFLPVIESNSSNLRVYYNDTQCSDQFELNVYNQIFYNYLNCKDEFGECDKTVLDIMSNYSVTSDDLYCGCGGAGAGTFKINSTDKVIGSQFEYYFYVYDDTYNCDGNTGSEVGESCEAGHIEDVDETCLEAKASNPELYGDTKCCTCSTANCNITEPCNC